MNDMMRAFLRAEPFWVVALAALPFAACSGAPEPPRPANPSSSKAAAPEADAGTPQTAPVAGGSSNVLQPDAQPPATEPSGVANTVPPASAATDQPPPPTPAPPSPAAPESPCSLLRGVKNAEPLFARPPLPCDRADRILYYRRTADGTCGPSSALTVTADGDVALGTAIAGDTPTVAAGACPSTKTVRAKLDPRDARQLISSACAAVNDGYSLENGIGCGSAAVRLYFFEGEAKLGETAALPCPPHALDLVVAELEAIAAERR